MEYKITAVQRRNEWNAGYGQMQDYAITLEGHDGWVKLTQKLDTPPPNVGDTLYGVIEEKRNKNGTPYTKFKKLQRDQQAQGAKPQTNNNQLDYIVKMLEELTGRREFTENESPQSQAEDSSQVEDVGDPFEDLGI